MMPKGYEGGEEVGLYIYREDFCYGELSFFILEEFGSNILDIMGKQLYWDDELGKHSEGYYSFTEDTVDVISYDKDFIDDFIKLCGDKVNLYTVKEIKETILGYD